MSSPAVMQSSKNAAASVLYPIVNSHALTMLLHQMYTQSSQNEAAWEGHGPGPAWKCRLPCRSPFRDRSATTHSPRCRVHDQRQMCRGHRYRRAMHVATCITLIGVSGRRRRLWMLIFQRDFLWLLYVAMWLLSLKAASALTAEHDSCPARAKSGSDSAAPRRASRLTLPGSCAGFSEPCL